MYQFKISFRAKQDLRDITFYKAEYDADYAIAFVDKLVDRFEQLLSAFPNAGVVYDRHIRKITIEEYTAFYSVIETPETVNILRIIDQGMPLEARGIDFN